MRALYCFDSKLGLLVSGDSALGGLVAMNTTSGHVRVLLKSRLEGIIGEAALDCDSGVVVTAVVDSPTHMRLLAFDFSLQLAGRDEEEVMGKRSRMDAPLVDVKPFVNVSVVDIHSLYFAERPL